MSITPYKPTRSMLLLPKLIGLSFRGAPCLFFSKQFGRALAPWADCSALLAELPSTSKLPGVTQNVHILRLHCTTSWLSAMELDATEPQRPLLLIPGGPPGPGRAISRPWRLHPVGGFALEAAAFTNFGNNPAATAQSPHLPPPPPRPLPGQASAAACCRCGPRGRKRRGTECG